MTNHSHLVIQIAEIWLYLCVLAMIVVVAKVSLEWDSQKDLINQSKHGVSFATAQYAFADPKRVIAENLSHSHSEKRYYCFGEVAGGIMRVRFTYREKKIRIFGAGYWRKGKRIYEHENQIHR